MLNQWIRLKNLNERIRFNKGCTFEEGRNCASLESRLKSQTESLVVDKFPLRRGTESRTRFHGIAWPATRNRFPARKVEEHYVEPSPAGSGCQHPVASRRSNIISGKQFPERGPSLPRIHRYIKITRRHAGTVQRLSSLSSSLFLVAITRVASNGEQNPSRIKSVPLN